MGPEGALRPGSVERRYSALTEPQKATYYAFRKHLGYTPAQVDNELSWWERKMFTEMLNEELKTQDEDEDAASGTYVTDDLSALGLTINQTD